jgi:lipopolysaccharide/colanic/teichoic acid biosynthesis glycosyltransferase
MYRSFGKRVFDIFLVFLFAPLWLVVCIFAGILIFVFDGCPLLFLQKRPGLHGFPFLLIKFRTMKAAEDIEELSSRDDEARITKIGKWLRRTSTDELPELINVVKGDMSLVGPRPLLMEYLDRYDAEQARRNDVRPGLTGWAQVNGRNAISWEEKFKHDVWYVDNLSLWLDLKILLMTVWQVLAGNGVSAEGHATMPEFMGGERE